jgi:hypothetical protein
MKLSWQSAWRGAPWKIGATSFRFDLVWFSLGAGVALLLAVVGAFIIQRRIAGALIESSPTSGLLMVSGSLCALAAASGLTLADGKRHPLAAQSIRYALAGGVILLATGFTMPGASPTALFAVWFFCFVTLGGLVFSNPRPKFASWQHQPPVGPTPWRWDFRRPLAERSKRMPGTVVSQSTRTRLHDGVQMIRGWVLISFAPGQRAAVAHTVFCPPFAALPRVTAVCDNVTGARISVAQVLHQGARFEVRLRQAAPEPQSLKLRFTATGPGDD